MNNPFLKKLLYKSSKTGILENDLILGTFAQRNLSSMSIGELKQYDRMLYENDWDIFHWIIGKKTAPSEYNELVLSIQKSMIEKKSAF